jgi:2-amino-4-hydroxy-6-hydroxymethyldihydropteridine diphosphokinase
LGSNYEQANNLSEARECLSRLFADIRYSSELWTEPIGNKKKPVCPEGQTGEDVYYALYLNQLAEATTSLSPEEINLQLKAIESALGRTPVLRQRGIVPIDLDLLLYDDQRFHERDWQRPYVTRLLHEVTTISSIQTS